MKFRSLVFIAAQLLTPAYADEYVPSPESVQETIALAERGDGDHQSRLSVFYAQGKVFPQDYKQAVFWARKSAEQGNTIGRFLLAEAYRTGNGVPQNYIQAYAWLAAGVAHGSRGVTLTMRDRIAQKMTPADLSEGQRLAAQYFEMYPPR